MTACTLCTSDNVSISHVDVDAREFGLPSGTFRNVLVTECADCGESVRSLPAQGAILLRYRRALVRLARPLSGDEFAFLRRTLGVTGRAYAEAVGTTNVTISRAENAGKVPALQDGLLRAVTLLDIEGCSPLEEMKNRVDEQVVIDVSRLDRRRLEITDGWETMAEQYVHCAKAVSFRSKLVDPQKESKYEFTLFDAVNDPHISGVAACR